MGLRAMIYFEVVTTLALLIGLLAVNILKPGVGLVLPAATGRPAIAAAAQTWDQILLHTFPTSIIDAMAEGRRAADRRLQHPLRDRARHDRRRRRGR